MKIVSRGITNTGRVRKGNEDSFLCDDDVQVWAVADGMGGHDAGEVASDMAVTGLFHAVKDRIPKSDDDLRACVSDLNLAIYQYGLENSLSNGLGTTLTGVIRTSEGLRILHIGDSRCYLLRNGKMTQITTDHSWVQHQVDRGELTLEQAQTHPLKNVIMRSLGYDVEAWPDIISLDIEVGDRYLLVSDGLSNKVDGDDLRAVISRDDAANEIVHTLVDLANQRGGEDNITVVLLDITDG